MKHNTKEIKLIACDMDGTLLNNMKQLSEKTIKIVRQLNDEGIYFILATGRHDSMIKSYINMLNNKMPVISCNGALVRNPQTKKTFFSSPISKEKILYTIDICRYFDAAYHIYCTNSIFSPAVNGRVPFFNSINETLNEGDKINIIIKPDFKGFINNTEEELFKILIIPKNPEDFAPIRKQIKNIELEPTQSDINFIDTMSIRVNKAEGLKALAENLKIKRENIIAIGNQINDIEMIKYAGYGIAMANAEKEVKQSADIISKNDNDKSGAIEAIINVLYG